MEEQIKSFTLILLKFSKERLKDSIYEIDSITFNLKNVLFYLMLMTLESSLRSQILFLGSSKNKCSFIIKIQALITFSKYFKFQELLNFCK